MYPGGSDLERGDHPPESRTLSVVRAPEDDVGVGVDLGVGYWVWVSWYHTRDTHHEMR